MEKFYPFLYAILAVEIVISNVMTLIEYFREGKAIVYADYYASYRLLSWGKPTILREHSLNFEPGWFWLEVFYLLIRIIVFAIIGPLVIFR